MTTLFSAGPTCPHAPSPLPFDRLLLYYARQELPAPPDEQFRAWKTALPAFSPAVFEPGKPAAKAHVLSINAFVIDQDNQPPGVVEAVCKTQSLEYWRWRTVSMQTCRKSHAYRYVIPFTKPVDPAQWPQIWQSLTDFFGGTNDKATKNSDRKSYLPLIVGGVSPELTHVDGAKIDLENTTFTKLLQTERQAPDLVNLDYKTMQKTFAALIAKEKDPKMVGIFKQLREGEAFAVDGDRHAAILLVTRRLVQLMPDVATAAIAGLFSKSLAAMGSSHSFSDIERAIDGAREKYQARKNSRRAALVRLARGDGLTTPYSHGELQEMAKDQRCALQDLQYQYLLQHGDHVYVLTHAKGYDGPYTRANAATYAQILSPFDVSYNPQRPGQALEYHGLTIKDVVYSLAEQKSRFDNETGILYRATAASKKSWQPVRHPDVERWLASFASEHVLDWLACAPDPRRALAALGIYGEPSAGKSLLAVGLAKLWGDGRPADPHEIFESNFNASLATNAVLFIDEYTPNKHARPLAAQFKAMLGSNVNSLREKYMRGATLEGYVRIIMAGNDDLPLQLNETIGKRSQDALAERVLTVKLNKETAEILKECDAPSFAAHKIAEHALWLNQTREIPRPTGQRFWVQGGSSETIDRLVMTNRPTANIAEWLVKFIINENPMLLNKYSDLWSYRENALWVNVQLLGQAWQLLSDERYKPATATIKAALEAISVSRDRLVVGGRRRRFWQLDTRQLEQLAMEYGLAEVGELQEIIEEKC